MRFIRRNYPECEWGKVDKSMYQTAKDMGMVPTMKLRWCCAKFKESAGAGKVTLTGVRHAESIKRAQRKEVEVSGHKFAGSIEDFFDWSAEKIAKKVKNLNQDEFSRDKAQEVRCINGKDSIIVNPIIEWTDADVWDFLNKVVEVPHCELYDPPYNRHRIGCILCPMSSIKTKLRDIELYPYAKKEWLKVFEYFIGGGYTPEYRKCECTPKSGGGNLLSKESNPVPGNGNSTTRPLRMFAERSKQITPLLENTKRQAQMGSCLPKDGGQGRAGVSLSAEVLFDWWLTHDSWETFKANREYPTLFEDEE